MALESKKLRWIFNFFQLKIKQEYISYFFACICIILIPVYTWYIPPFVALWGGGRILEICLNRKDGRSDFFIKQNLTLPVLFMTFFFLQVLSLIYSENLTNGLNIVLSRLSLLIFPLLFISPGRQIYNNRKLLLKLFAGGTIVYIAFCFLYAISKSISINSGNLVINTHPPEGYWLSYFFGSYFSVNQHPSYVAIFVIISILIALESIMDTDLKIKRRILWILSGVILLVSLYFLSSRAAIVILLLVIPFNFFLKIQTIKKFSFAITLMILLLIPGFLIIRTNERIGYYIEQLSQGRIKEKFAKDSRIMIWKSSLNIIRNNPVLGVGIGDVRDELVKEYEKSGDKELIESRYNAHNQFLETTIEGGIINLMAFIFIIVYMIFKAIETKNRFLILFVTIIIVFFMFETVIYRLAGVVFFSYFSFLLIQDSSYRID
jgi:O-antigen ligase